MNHKSSGKNWDFFPPTSKLDFDQEKTGKRNGFPPRTVCIYPENMFINQLKCGCDQ